MAKVFISFVHEDRAVAAAVQHILLRFVDIEVFLSTDQTQVFAGDMWLQKIRQSLQEAELVILMLSKRSVHRAWVNFEAGAAWLADKRIIPCCYGNLSKAALPHPYSGIQALSLAAEVNYLVSSVCHHLGIEQKEQTDADIAESLEDFNGLQTALDEFVDIEGSFVTKRKRKN